MNKWEALVELARVFADRDRPGLAFATVCVIALTICLAAIVPILLLSAQLR